ncbi:MAG: co-chaperone DjlA [Gammaproteobacteria bacterium]|nr:co-chaperone DjlA [Gammaproteobacteria bacterium]
MYWGRIIGTFLGAIVGVLLVSPVLKVLSVAAGYLAGRQFDRGFAAERRAFDDLGAGSVRLSDDYVRALFRCMGHLAKADGRVSEEEIRAARLVMHRLNLSPAQVRKAIHWFDDGKQPGFSLVQTVRELRRVHARRADQRTLFVRFLLEVVLAGSRLRSRERSLVWTICTELDIGRVELAQLEAMILAQKGFRRSPAGTADTARLGRAYATLGVDESSTNDEIKRAYRRLMNRNHPDKIAGSDPDESAIAEAQRRTREIRGAYEMLKARRSIR